MLHRAAVIVIAAALSAGAPVFGDEADATRETRPEKGYFKRHLLHWAVAFGTNFLSEEYQDRVGTSTDPLLFSDPTSLDRWVRNGLRSDTPTKNWVLERRAVVGLVLTGGTMVLANLGHEGAGRWMAEDFTGLFEIWVFDKGAGQLVKNIVGRQRPMLEFIDQNGDLTPAERVELETNTSERHSFYSGATSRQFALMSYCNQIVAGRTHRRAVRVASFIGFYGFAAYVGWSRMERDEHYFTDVVAGAAAGIFTARGFYRAHHPRPGRTPGAEEQPPKISLQSLTPLPGGAAVMFTVRL